MAASHIHICVHNKCCSLSLSVCHVHICTHISVCCCCFSVCLSILICSHTQVCAAAAVSLRMSASHMHVYVCTSVLLLVSLCMPVSHTHKCVNTHNVYIQVRLLLSLCMWTSHIHIRVHISTAVSFCMSASHFHTCVHISAAAVSLFTSISHMQTSAHKNKWISIYSNMWTQTQRQWYFGNQHRKFMYEFSWCVHIYMNLSKNSCEHRHKDSGISEINIENSYMEFFFANQYRKLIYIGTYQCLSIHLFIRVNTNTKTSVFW